MSDQDEALAARDLASQSYLYTVIATNSVATRWRDVPLTAPTAQLTPVNRLGDDDWVAAWTGGAGIRDRPSISAKQADAPATAPVPAAAQPESDMWDTW